MKKVTSEFELEEHAPSEVKKRSKSRTGWEYMSSPGVYLIVPILAGLAFGIWLDSVFATKPIFTLIFLLAGVVSSMYNLSKLTQTHAHKE